MQAKPGGTLTVWPLVPSERVAAYVKSSGCNVANRSQERRVRVNLTLGFGGNGNERTKKTVSPNCLLQLHLSFTVSVSIWEKPGEGTIHSLKFIFVFLTV